MYSQSEYFCVIIITHTSQYSIEMQIACNLNTVYVVVILNKWRDFIRDFCKQDNVGRKRAPRLVSQLSGMIGVIIAWSVQKVSGMVGVIVHY